jgi:transcription elongation GreA/GreB family factor
MSRAFVKETDAETIELPERPVSEHPNFVTAEGLTAIERELAAAQRELRYWTARRTSAQLIASPNRSEPGRRAGVAIAEAVHFGATVTVRRDDGRTQRFRIVGEDEAEPSRGTLSHVSPLARALFGKTVGDVANVAGGTAEILKIE